jgi:hypothetical protein
MKESTLLYYLDQEKNQLKLHKDNIKYFGDMGERGKEHSTKAYKLSIESKSRLDDLYEIYDSTQ